MTRPLAAQRTLARPAVAERTLAATVTLLAVLSLGEAAHPRTARAQAMGEYGRAGTQVHTSSRSPVPRVPKAAAAGSSSTQGAHLIRAQHTAAASESHAQGPPIWSEAWFSNRALVRGQIQEMVQSITASMIGERYPLPRGGGYRCTQPTGGAETNGDGRSWAMRCVGSEVGGQRENDFSVLAPGTAPVLERVRWLVVASGRPEAWHGFYQELTDSLTRAIGPPSWAAADHAGVRWNGNGSEITARLHGTSAYAESLEVTCVSDRLAETRRSAAP